MFRGKGGLKVRASLNMTAALARKRRARLPPCPSFAQDRLFLMPRHVEDYAYTHSLHTIGRLTVAADVLADLKFWQT
ncbi:hypothetical protein SAMN05443244_3160 [Terriglobus roseus]|uniref:Uncharacterized protein n=1 Tax=Terriglobus roseus TaxID=392734 RepID=A0A1H4RHT3_9BACT|nr:hypothetical protein SAMN05443244_3160 [Terriglobus roseus]